VVVDGTVVDVVCCTVADPSASIGGRQLVSETTATLAARTAFGRVLFITFILLDSVPSF
jgi:hypothetical protein